MFTNWSENWRWRRIVHSDAGGMSRADFSWDGNAEDIGGLVCLAIDAQPDVTETL